MIAGGKIVKKVVFTLSDGRKVTVSHRGRALLWETEDLNSLRSNIRRYGRPCFTSDLRHYDVSRAALRGRFPKERLVEVTDFQTLNPMGRPPKDNTPNHICEENNHDEL